MVALRGRPEPARPTDRDAGVAQGRGPQDRDLWLIAARPGSGGSATLASEHPPEALASRIGAFSNAVAGDLAHWHGLIEGRRQRGQKTVLWGGGSKAVAFLTTLGLTDGIDDAVGLNPARAGTFIAGTGQQIVAPAILTEYRPEGIIVMSPIYLPEITTQLDAMGVRPNELLTVESSPQRAAA